MYLKVYFTSKQMNIEAFSSRRRNPVFYAARETNVKPESLKEEKPRKQTEQFCPEIPVSDLSGKMEYCRAFSNTSQ